MGIRRRKYEEIFFKKLALLSSIFLVVILLVIVISIIIKAIPALSIEMISQTPKGGFYLGGGGGILNAIVGSLYLAFGATLLAFLLGFPVVIYMNIYANPNSRFVNLLRLVLDILWGIPSIVYGVFGFVIMIFLGIKASLLGGILIVALFILPVIIRSIDELILMIPRGLTDAAYSLGSTKFETAFKVVIRQVSSGIVTALLIAFGRAIGDAAAVLFTTGYTDNIPTSLSQPTATLPLAIFFQLGSPIEAVQQRAYASAFVLTVIILLISVITRVSARKYKKFKV